MNKSNPASPVRQAVPVPSVVKPQQHFVVDCAPQTRFCPVRATPHSPGQSEASALGIRTDCTASPEGAENVPRTLCRPFRALMNCYSMTQGGRFALPWATMCSPAGAELKQTTSSFASLHLFLALLLVSVFSACGQTPQQEQTEDNRLVVAVDNYPLLYITSRLTDETVNVKLLAPEDIDPAMWNPSPEKIAEIQKADLMLTNGAGYSSWLSRVSLDEDKLINTSAAAEADYIEIKDAVTHQHGPEGEHTHSGTAFTTWLDFNLARQQTRATANALMELLPPEMKKERTQVENEIVKLESDFFSFDGRMKSLVKAAKQPKMIGSHPVYQYLARRYEIPMESVHWEPGETPDSKQWEEFDALREKHPADIMLWEAEPTAETRKQLEDRGLKVVVFNPAANVPTTGDFIEIMDANIARLEAATDAPLWPPN